MSVGTPGLAWHRRGGGGSEVEIEAEERVELSVGVDKRDGVLQVSKKVENHEHALAIHYMFYNFARVHQSLRVTPAMEAGLSDHVWNIDEIVKLIELGQ